MSSALKIATLASSFGLLSVATLFSARTPEQNFSRSALALDHVAEERKKGVVGNGILGGKVPSNFVSFTTVGGYEIKSAA